jgi:hypothetical protein
MTPMPNNPISAILKNFPKLAPKIPNVVKTPLAFYITVLFVVETLVLTLVPILPESQRTYAFGVAIGMVVFLVVIVTVMAIWFRFALTGIFPLHFEILANREALYLKASEILKRATHVLDTTWGLNPQKLTDKEKIARDLYILAQQHAIDNDIPYMELYGATDLQKEQAARSKIRFHNRSNYKVKHITDDSVDISMIDFLIADGTEILLSRVDSANVTTRHRYLYINSEPMAAIFSDQFHECWHNAVPRNKPG